MTDTAASCPSDLDNEEPDQPSSAATPTPQHLAPPRMAGAGGGVADKLGNKYELAWAIRHALFCIQDERRSLTLEEIDPELADGSEFTYVNEHGDTSVTQVKRQNNITDHWTIAALRGRGVLAAAARHVAAGREFHFSSMTPSGALRVMAERSRQSADAQRFVKHQLTQKLGETFDELTAANVFGSSERAWQTLRGMWIEVEVEEQLVMTNAMLAEVSLEGATGDLMAVAIGAVLLDNLRTRVTRRELLDALDRYGITPRGAVARRTSHEQVMATTQSWRGTVERELLALPIERQEAADLVDLMTTTRLALVVGAGGGGKSSVLYQAARDLEAQGAEVLAFRLDRRGAFGSTMELGTQLGLSTSPVAALRQAADGRDAFLIIDQLDAVSLASGRLSERYDVIADLIQEATAVDGVRVILACRLFDVENDHRIRKLDARNDVERLTVEPLPEEASANAVSAMGLDPDLLTATQRTLLRSPLNLVLLETIADQPGALNFTSRGSLFEAFWQRKEQTSEERRPGTLFNDVLARIANTASDNQTLSVPVEILGPGDSSSTRGFSPPNRSSRSKMTGSPSFTRLFSTSRSPASGCHDSSRWSNSCAPRSKNCSDARRCGRSSSFSESEIPIGSGQRSSRYLAAQMFASTLRRRWSPSS
ncbi:hypothetical protein [Gordonia malaquae]|uniref:nSTAND1 domain-containing NTPase n=1 Tax=Gordonia malaquae TaxID=410332 RepID=UPI0030FECB09